MCTSSFLLKLRSNQLVCFLVVGGSTTLLQFILLLAMVESGFVPEVGASALSYFLAAIYNYVLNYYVTFSSDKSHLDTVPKFVAVVAVGLSVNTAVFAIVNLVLPYYLLSQVMATGTAVVVNFLLHKYWIYRV